MTQQIEYMGLFCSFCLVCMIEDFSNQTTRVVFKTYVLYEATIKWSSSPAENKNPSSINCSSFILNGTLKTLKHVYDPLEQYSDRARRQEDHCMLRSFSSYKHILQCGCATHLRSEFAGDVATVNSVRLSFRMISHVFADLFVDRLSMHVY